MGKSNVIELEYPTELCDPLTEMLRTGARQLIYESVEAHCLIKDREALMAFYDFPAEHL